MSRNHASRNARRSLARRLKSGNQELRVLGNEKSGFLLGAVLESGFWSLGGSFDRQKDAIATGERVFGQKAKKLLKAA
jgi:hypothetical protein